MHRTDLVRLFSRATLSAALLLGATALGAAQTGPFVDGELLVRVPDQLFGTSTIHRVDAVTGSSSPLISQIYQNYSKGGWIAYDPPRDALLAYCAYEPQGLFTAKLFQIESDGSIAEIGFVGEKIRALAPVGDGRVYCFADTTLHVLDENNVLTPVLDPGGLAVDLPIDHLVYDPPTNSLIGVARTGVGCADFKELAVYRLSLSPNGLAIAAPVCSVYPFGAASWPIGLDHLPGGKLLVTLVGGFLVQERFLEIDPATLGVSVWAETDWNDLDGSVWVPALGGAVVLEDSTNTLRFYPPGGSGDGVLIPTAQVMGDQTSGVSSSNGMADIDLLGPGCGGLAKSFGAGLAGTGGATPHLGAGSCPSLGSSLRLNISNGVGGAPALLLLGLNGGALPTAGGTLYVLPPFSAAVGIQLGGTLGQAGAGLGLTSILVPALPGLLGLPIYGQAVVVDGAAPFGFSFTRGLEIRVG